MGRAPIPPLVFAPILLEKIWGGARLLEAAGIPVPAGRRIGEAWILADRRGASTAVREGPFAGRTLRSLLEERGREILGAGRENGEAFPLLVKVLDAADLLSLQVHPDDEAARREGEADRGKHEAWVFLRVGERAKVLAGLRPGIGREGFERLLRSGDSESGLRSLEVVPGGILPIPAGTVHAISDAVFLEVQTNSDVTYRLSDWGRAGEGGRPREIHVEKGLRALRLDSRPEPSRGRLDLDPHFRISLERGEALRAGGRGRAAIVVPLEGEGVLQGDGESARWARGEAWLLPASLGEVSFAASGAGSRWALVSEGEG